MQIEHRGWMVETAEKYCTAAELLAKENNLCRQAQINAALSIEILLKSYLSRTKEYEGEIYETYQSKREHNLVKLADMLPVEVRSYLDLSEPQNGYPKSGTRRCIERYAKTFTEERYIYESSKNKLRPGFSTSLTRTARILIDKTISLYISTGSDDPWIKSFV
ncbi:hypothetical protein [Vibrio nigripulchritudo]|uniref:hypothetical protein n=1 Tax=Vibrio nigripulchritudo TaxID=28173 RepID=UPI0003B2333E|nr:hypothetical protein [Vibrio nigripulchritudo]CCN71979.1 hypothetical protein VIBNISFn118_470083 [Vibrio nigripulchritudo SFn118]